MSKVIQISVSSGGADDPDYLYALCEDGRIWLRLPEVTAGGTRLHGRWLWTEVRLGEGMKDD
jgi:hypothetical protein